MRLSNDVNGLSEIDQGFDQVKVYRALSIIVLCQIISFFSVLPYWLSANAALVAVFGFIFCRASGAFFRWLYTAVSVAVFALFYRLNFTVEMAAAFLMMSASLKLLEIKSRRDIYLLIFVMLYLASVSFLFDQRFFHTVFQFFILMGCFAVLLIINSGSGLNLLTHQWRSLFKLLVFALPLVIVCFLFFPRIAPLWSIPIKTQNGATTGMSESMSPGDIANLSQSSDRAFRVEFSGDAPAQSSLYWRGLILDYFDGREWRKSARQSQFEPPRKADLGRFYNLSGESYEVMLEPHNQKWVFALEGSSPSSSNLKAGDMGLFELTTDAIQATRYKMKIKASENTVDSSLFPTGRTLRQKKRTLSVFRQDLQLPIGSNPRTREYIKDLKAKFSTDEQLVSHLLKQFSRQSFYYTLKPPLLGEHFVDEFIFDSRQGFCSHYAGSLVFMLRLAGIPARVVVGYQGGEYNADQNYYIVHQYDAHAWVEAYIYRYGWIRLDPTALVAPDRIRMNLQEAVKDEGTFLSDSPVMAAALSTKALSWLRLRLDEMNYRWQKWVVNYGEGQQISLVKELLGEYSLSRIVWLFVITFVAIMALLYFYFWRTMHRSALTLAQSRYLRWLSVLKRFGYVRQTGESPKAFMLRVQQGEHPRLADITVRKTQELEQAEYQ